MHELSISLADITIGLATEDAGLTLQAVGSVEKFFVRRTNPEVRIRALLGDLSTDEKPGEMIFDSGGIWQLYADNGSYRFLLFSSLLGSIPYKEGRFSADFTSGEITLHRPYFASGHMPYALEYPLDELLLMHLLADGRGAEVHACGVVDRLGNGHLFVGQSGAGKTTMARLWHEEKHVKILSDDRIVLRHVGGRFLMYGTPWHGEGQLADPSKATLSRVYFLRHGDRNTLIPLSPAAAVGRLFACSFPPFYSASGLDFTLRFFEEVVKAVKCDELGFVPDEQVVGFIKGLSNE